MEEGRQVSDQNPNTLRRSTLGFQYFRWWRFFCPVHYRITCWRTFRRLWVGSSRLNTACPCLYSPGCVLFLYSINSHRQHALRGGGTEGGRWFRLKTTGLNKWALWKSQETDEVLWVVSPTLKTKVLSERKQRSTSSRLPEIPYASNLYSIGVWETLLKPFAVYEYRMWNLSVIISFSEVICGRQLLAMQYLFRRIICRRKDGMLQYSLDFTGLNGLVYSWWEVAGDRFYRFLLQLIFHAEEHVLSSTQGWKRQIGGAAKATTLSFRMLFRFHGALFSYIVETL